jgi:hypothetical protein
MLLNWHDLSQVEREEVRWRLGVNEQRAASSEVSEMQNEEESTRYIMQSFSPVHIRKRKRPGKI